MMQKRILKIAVCIFGLGLALEGSSSERWEILEEEKIRIFYKPEDLTLGHTLLSMVKEQLPELLWLFQWSARDTVEIYIAENKKRFNLLTGNAIPEWGIAAVDFSKNQIYFQSSNFHVSEAELRQMVTHELCHWVMHKASHHAKMDRWFTEGVAVYVSKEYGLWEKLRVAQSFLFGQTLQFKEIDQVLRFNPEKAALAYAESVSAVEYLISQYGFEAVQEIVVRTAQSISFSRAFRASIGMDLTEFEQTWMRHIKRQYATYLMLHFSFLLSLVFVILFFMAMWTTYRRTREIQKHWEKGETDEEEKVPENSPWHGISNPSDGDALDMDEFSSHRPSVC